MDTHSIREVAAILGTFVPRIQRAVDCPGLRLDPGTKGRRVNHDQVEQLRRRLGSAPPEPGLTREDPVVLAALACLALIYSSRQVRYSDTERYGTDPQATASESASTDRGSAPTPPQATTFSAVWSIQRLDTGRYRDDLGRSDGCVRRSPDHHASPGIPRNQ
jgi:hypothetical protein